MAIVCTHLRCLFKLTEGCICYYRIRRQIEDIYLRQCTRSEIFSAETRCADEDNADYISIDSPVLQLPVTIHSLRLEISCTLESTIEGICTYPKSYPWIYYPGQVVSKMCLNICYSEAMIWSRDVPILEYGECSDKAIDILLAVPRWNPQYVCPI